LIQAALTGSTTTRSPLPGLDPYIFPGEPELYANDEKAELLRDALAGLDAVVVAVGAGTMNHLVRRACSEIGRPYAVVGTAASMDGYTAFGGGAYRYFGTNSNPFLEYSNPHANTRKHEKCHLHD